MNSAGQNSGSSYSSYASFQVLSSSALGSQFPEKMRVLLCRPATGRRPPLHIRIGSGHRPHQAGGNRKGSLDCSSGCQLRGEVSTLAAIEASSMPRPLFVNGYHGTRASNLGAILSHGFQLSRNSYDWLGNGIYFWQDAPQRAKEWTEQSLRMQGLASVEPVVLKARLKLSNCIDLLDVGWRDVVTEAAGDFLKSVEQKIGSRIVLRNSTSGRHELDCAFFNYFVGWLRLQKIEVGAIRAAIAEGEPILPGSPIRFRSHVQIAVLNPALISNPTVID